MYIRVSLRGMLRMIRVDILRRVHIVGFPRGTAQLFHSLRSKEDIIISGTDIHRLLLTGVNKVCHKGSYND